ncbi:MAG: glutamate formimidoyltransferase [Actinomycetota bacterium]|nr:glutamate formimidoyltransferase [Actinomycetota bacterium]
MHPPLFEAVPNFSEGRDAEKISRIVAAVRAVEGVRVLGLHSDADHNRSVLTLAGEEGPILEAAAVLAEACAAEIDLASQSGEHPRIGSLDVLPFVPLEGATLEDAARLARKAGERIGALGLPVYLYEAAASAPHRRNLADVRRGGYEGLATRIKDPRWHPDFGPRELDPHRGAVAVGARPFLVAFNAYLDTGDVEVARAIARKVRESGGGLAGVKALGLNVGGRAQVSMNLTDLEKTPIPVALEAVRAAAAGRGASVESTELVGLAPLEALLQTARHYLKLRELEREHVLESALWDAR